MLLWNRICCLCFVCLWVTAARAQPGDSAIVALKRQLATARPDTHKVLLLDELCWQLSQTELPAARRYGEQGLALARQLKYRKGEANCLNDLGNAAMLAFDLPAATVYYQQALRAFRALRKPKGEVFALVGLGNVAVQQKDPRRAAELYLQALSLARRLTGEPAVLALVLTDLSGVLADLATSTDARPYATEALALYRRLENPLGEATALKVIGQIELLEKKYAAAERYLQAAVRLLKQNGADFQLSHALHSLCVLYLDTKRPAEALATAREVLALSQRIGALDQAAFAAEAAAAATEELGQLQRSLDYYRLYRQYKDTLITQENQRALSELRVRFDVEQQEVKARAATERARRAAQQARQAQARTRWLLAGVLGLLGVSALLLVLARRLHRARTELAAAQATQNRLYALIGHDLRSPITAFSGLLDLLPRYRRRGDLTQLEATEAELRQASSALRRLLDNLLLWAASQQGELQAQPEEVDAQELLHEAADLYASAAQARQIRLEVDAPTTGLRVRADRQMTQAVLRNFLDNALRVSEEGKTIFLAAVPMNSRRVQLRVRDQGPGLSEAQVAGLRAGQRISEGRPAAGRSTGLGLRLSRLLAERQSGRLLLEPAPTGTGLVAALELPAA